jgi:hypothetical protein
MRVVPTLGLRSIAAAVAMLDDPTTVAVIRQESESRHAASQSMPTPKGFLRRPERRFI